MNITCCIATTAVVFRTKHLSKTSSSNRIQNPKRTWKKTFIIEKMGCTDHCGFVTIKFGLLTYIQGKQWPSDLYSRKTMSFWPIFKDNSSLLAYIQGKYWHFGLCSRKTVDFWPIFQENSGILAYIQGKEWLFDLYTRKTMSFCSIIKENRGLLQHLHIVVRKIQSPLLCSIAYIERM